jgi:O-antigen/teichoic acid export membrane protein
LAPGSVTWLGYADRLMEFPTAMLGVALGVVLLPALTQAKASGDLQRYSGLIDDGLRWVLALGLPCAVALLVFAKPLVSVLFHYGAFTERDLAQTSLALVGYGIGLVGLVAIKVLAPGFYASQDTRTPMQIALVVLVLTQLLNLVLVPWLAHAGLAMAIGLGLVVVMPTSASDAWLFTAMVLAGIGFGFFQTPNNRVMLGSAPRNRAGAVGGLQATTRVFSQTFGAAIVAVVFSFGFSGGPMLGLCVAIGFALIAVGVNTLRYFQAPRSRADG